MKLRVFAGNDSNSETTSLSWELNQRITQERNDLLRSVSSQIQRAISEANNAQVLPQIQASLKSGQGQMPGKVWNVRINYSGAF